jgi:hypothetical protein
MSAPNLVNVTTVIGNTSSVSLSTTSATSMASNAASSSTVYKVESIVVANTSASAATITINVYSAAALGGTAFPIASTISVPAHAALIVTDKTTSFYLLENQSIGAVAGTSSALVVTTAWEQMS